VERIVTVTGRGVARPSNLIVPVGTRLRDLLDFCGGTTADAREVVFGGPMMGMAQAHLDTPILKGTTGVVVLTEADVRARRSYPCIHCGRCLEACPVFLDPQHLGALARTGRYDEMEAASLADCMLCGSCAYVCPSGIPLTQLFQLSKAALRRRKTGAA
jgi:Na+-translocating ferredoxin:NAD+ oxidoreductase subunit C